MQNPIKRVLESILWNSRFIVILAVASSLAASVAMFWITSVDMFYAISHLGHYADSSLADEARKVMRDGAVTHVVEVVDGYLLASVMLIFALGLYELFVSDIGQADGSTASSKILVIDSLDDLKTKLAKVILMILIVRLFEYAVKMRPESMLELVYFGAAIALAFFPSPWGLQADKPSASIAASAPFTPLRGFTRCSVCAAASTRV
jgi:uncharacterized membrane protein YqhA